MPTKQVSTTTSAYCGKTYNISLPTLMMVMAGLIILVTGATWVLVTRHSRSKVQAHEYAVESRAKYISDLLNAPIMVRDGKLYQQVKEKMDATAKAHGGTNQGTTKSSYLSDLNAELASVNAIQKDFTAYARNIRTGDPLFHGLDARLRQMEDYTLDLQARITRYQATSDANTNLQVTGEMIGAQCPHDYHELMRDGTRALLNELTTSLEITYPAEIVATLSRAAEVMGGTATLGDLLGQAGGLGLSGTYELLSVAQEKKDAAAGIKGEDGNPVDRMVEFKSLIKRALTPGGAMQALEDAKAEQTVNNHYMDIATREAAKKAVEQTGVECSGFAARRERDRQALADSFKNWPKFNPNADPLNTHIQGLPQQQTRPIPARHPFLTMYEKASPSCQAIADNCRDYIDRGGSMDDLLADPYMSQAARDDPFVSQMVDYLSRR
ncbi:MAG: hypothetical protein WCI73_12900 [Phycisphaerae bacterium]